MARHAAKADCFALPLDINLLNMPVPNVWIEKV
jgi:hypothetical protein